MVRKCLLAAAVSMALGSPVIGADLLPDYGGAPPLAPAWSFTGCYVGGNVGGRGLRVRNGSRALPAATFTANRSADMISMIGSEAFRPVATISLPAASWLA